MNVNEVILGGRFHSRDLSIYRRSMSESVKTSSWANSKYWVKSPTFIFDFGIVGSEESSPTLRYICLGREGYSRIRTSMTQGTSPLESIRYSRIANVEWDYE